MDHAKSGPTYFAIWGWLVGLLAAGLMVSHLPVGKAVAMTAIMATAVGKAVLVGRHYMHLKSESLVICAIGAVPVLLLIFMVLALVPDIVWRQ